MKILGQMRGFEMRPYDDSNGAVPNGVIALGSYVLTSTFTYRDSDMDNNINQHLVLRTFPASLSTRETGKVEALQQYLSTTDTPLPDALPYPNWGRSFGTIIKLDEQRALVIWEHQNGAWSDTNVYVPTYSTAFVVTMASNGSLTRGAFTPLANRSFTLDGIDYEHLPSSTFATLVAPDTVDVYMTTRSYVDNVQQTPNMRNDVFRVRLTVSGSTVTVGSVDPPEHVALGTMINGGGAFALNGQSYAVVNPFTISAYQDGNGVWVPSSQMPDFAMLHGAGQSWQMSQGIGYDYTFGRANKIGDAIWLLSTTSGYTGGVYQFDGTNLKLDRPLPTNTVMQSSQGSWTVDWTGGHDWWSVSTEVDLTSPYGLLVWDAWELLFGEVLSSGNGLRYVDLRPLVTAELLANQQGFTVAPVQGRNAVVEAWYYGDRPDGDSALTAMYFLVELVAPPRMGPGVHGAHFVG